MGFIFESHRFSTLLVAEEANTRGRRQMGRNSLEVPCEGGRQEIMSKEKDALDGERGER